MADLESILWTKKFQVLKDQIFSEENLDAQSEKIKKDVIDQLYTEYGININSDKRQVAKDLIDDLFEQHKIQYNDLVVNQLLSWKKIDIGDILSAMSSESVALSAFFLQLVGKGVIKGENLATNFFDSWVTMVQLSLSKIPWFSSEIAVENLSEEISNMSDEERRLALWVLYRKAWALAFFSSKLIEYSSRGLIEVVSGTPESALKMWAQSFQNLQKQNASYRKLEQAFWVNWWADLLDNTLSQLKNLRTNNEVITILKKWGSVKDIKNSIQRLINTGLDDDFLKQISNISTNDMSKFRDSIAQAMSPVNSKSIFEITWDLARKGITEYSFEMHKYKFLENINTVRSYQAQIIRWTLPSKVLASIKKTGEVLANMDIARSFTRDEIWMTFKKRRSMKDWCSMKSSKRYSWIIP